jgi:hypothetical protein
MSYCIAEVLNACPNIQRELTDYFSTCNHQFFREPYPFFEFIMSPLNQNGLSQVIAPGKGKVRTMELRYSKRLLESEVSSNQANPTCVATEKRGDCFETYTIDTSENEQASELISVNDLSATCRENPAIFMEILMRLMDAVERKVATKTTDEASTLTGAWATDVQNVVANKLRVKTLKDGTTDEMFPFTMEEIDNALIQTGYCDTPVTFAGTKLYQYYRRILAGCCSNSGLDLSQIMALYGKAVMYDRRVVNAFGDNDNAIVLQPKSVALLNWTLSDWAEGVPAFVTSGADYFKQVIVSPRTGLKMDLNVKDNCGQVSIIVTATTKLVGMPTDLFPVGDVYQNVNFFNQIEVSNV